MTRAGAVLGLVAGAAVRLAAQAPAPGDARVAADAPFQRILYLHGGPPRDESFWRRVRRLGFDAVSLSRGADPDEPGRQGLRFYADQAVGKGVLELREGEIAEIRERYEASRDERVLVRPACLSEPAVREGLRRALQETLDTVLPCGPLAVTLGDEISLTRHASPLDLCFGEACLLAFRAWLQRRHGTLEALNRAWGTTFPAWEHVRPLTTDRIRARELGGRTLPRNLRPWSEHRQFEDEKLAAVVAGLARRVARRAPGLPCGLTGLQPPSAFGGHDYGRLVPPCSFLEAYDIGGARALAASLAGPGAKRVATLFPPDAGVPSDVVRARLFDLLAHGFEGVIVWSAGTVLDGEARPTAYGAAVREAFAELEAVAEAAGGAAVVRDPVWIVESQAAVRAWWMLDSARDGDTWIRRLSSYEREHSTSLAARRSWQLLFEDLGVQPRWVVAERLPALLPRHPPRLLVLPATVALDEAAADAVADWVAAGGTAVADHHLALYDGNLQRCDAGALDAVFGVRRRSMEWDDQLVHQGRAEGGGRLDTGAAAAEAGLRGELAEPAGELRVQIEHRWHEGQTFYLNLAVCEYAAVRLDPERHAAALDLRQRLRRVLWGAGVRPPVLVRGRGLPTCLERLRLRGRDGRTLLAVRLNALDAPDLLGRLAREGARPVELTFPEPVTLRTLDGRVLGRGRQIEARLDPWTGLLVELDRER